MVNGWQVLLDGAFGCRALLSFPLCGNGLFKPLDSGLRRNDNEGWIPRPSFQTWLCHLGGSFQTPLYHLHPCRRASMPAGLRRNEDGAGTSLSVS